MKILLLISLTILACASLGECGCNSLFGQTSNLILCIFIFQINQIFIFFKVCVESRLQAGTYNDPFTLAEKYGVLLYVLFKTSNTGERVFNENSRRTLQRFKWCKILFKMGLETQRGLFYCIWHSTFTSITKRILWMPNFSRFYP